MSIIVSTDCSSNFTKNAFLKLKEKKVFSFSNFYHLTLFDSLKTKDKENREEKYKEREKFYKIEDFY